MIFEVTVERMIVFFLILAVGFAAGKLGIIQKQYLPHFAQIITKILLPVMIFYATVSSCTRQTVLDNVVLIALSAVFYVLIALVTFMLAKIMRLPHDRDRVFQFCFIFGNTGFVGIPLLNAVFPETGLLYMMLFSIVDQLVFWTYGIWLSTARDRQSAKFNPKMLLTPNIVAMLLALVFVLAGIPLPGIFSTTLGTISNATSAMCMMYLGTLVCFSDVFAALKTKDLYVGVLVKMIALPIIVGRLLMLTPLDPNMVMGLVLIMALPVMTVVPMIATQNGREGEYATGITVATLVVSIASIPLVAFLVGI